MSTSIPSSIRAMLCLAGALIALVPPCAQAQDDPAPPSTEIVRLQDDLSTPEARRAAAAALVEQASDEEVANSMATVLAAIDQDPDAARFVLEAIAAAPAPSQRLAPLLITTAPATPPDLRPALWGAMSRFSTQGVVAALIDAAQAADDSDRGPIIAALVHITGLELTSPDDWAAWFDAYRWVNELEWRRVLTQSLGAHRDRLAVAHTGAVQRLVELSRLMYLRLEPGPQRSARLAELLGDPEPAMRQLGFDLARRELLAAAGAVNGDVGAAAVALLDSDDPGVRAQAAGLVVQLAPAGAEDAVIRALAKERSPHAASALLAGVARWPNARAVTPVLTWVQRPEGTVRPAASTAALALARSDRFDADALTIVLDTIRQRDALIAPELRLLVIAGNDNDRQRVADMLRSPTPEIRRASADALVDRPEALDLIIASAAEDPALFKIAADMAVRHRPTLGGYNAVASLPAPDERARAESLTRLASVLPPQDLHAVVTTLEKADDRLALLTPRLEDELPDDPTQRQGLIACLLLYAETELNLAHPARALIALDRIRNEPLPDPEPMRAALATALLATGQFEAGASIDAGAGTWIRALEISISAEHAPTLLEQLRVRFADQLTDEQRATLATLAAAIERINNDQITDAGSQGGGSG